MSKRGRYIWLGALGVLGTLLALGAWHEMPGEDPDNQGGVVFVLLAFVILLFIYVPVLARWIIRSLDTLVDRLGHNKR